MSSHNICFQGEIKNYDMDTPLIWNYVERLEHFVEAQMICGH